MPVASPCVKICQLDPTGRVCLGCFRTLNEIGGWLGFTEEQRRAVVAACERRKQEHGRV